MRGLRAREEMPQAELAAAVGVKATHISEMERGKRPIGKDMAKRLAKVLKINYQVFLYNWLKATFQESKAPITRHP